MKPLLNCGLRIEIPRCPRMLFPMPFLARLQRINYTGVIDWVHTITPRPLLNLRLSGNRYVELGRTDDGFGYDASQLGLPKSLVDQLPVKMFPRIEASDYTSLARGSFYKEPTNTLSLQPNMAWMKGVHAIRAGLDPRMTQYSTQTSNWGGMQLALSRGYTQKVWNQGDALSGNSIASMLVMPGGRRCPPNDCRFCRTEGFYIGSNAAGATAPAT